MSERDMQRLLALVEKHLGAAFVEVTDWLRGLDANSVDEIERRLVKGDIAGVVQQVEAAALKFAAESQAGYAEAGRATAKWMDGEVADKLIRFDASGSRVIDHARRNQLEKVREATDDMRANVHQVMNASPERNPRAWARDIRDSIGLTEHQQGHVMNYRRALERGDWGNALGRELTTARDDRAVAAIVRRPDGNSLQPKQIDDMVERYRKNYITYRAETIARTESAKNVHAASNEAMRQAIERGDIEAGQIVREWMAGPRTKDARDSHQHMDGKTVKFGEMFVLPNGTRMAYPGDPSAPIAELANCRCTVATTLRL